MTRSDGFIVFAKAESDAFVDASSFDWPDEK